MDTSSAELLKQVNAQANTIGELRKRVEWLEMELKSTESSRLEWMGRTRLAEAKLDELRLAFKVLVRGGKED